MSFNSWAPGQHVRLTGHEDWGIGQIQSAIGTRVTVNFENAGKRVVDLTHASLVAVSAEDGVDTAE